MRSVLDPVFGVVANGIVDDTAAIQAAFDAGAYYFPQGDDFTYLISSPIAISSGSVSVIGDGGSRIVTHGDHSMLKIDCTKSIRGLVVDGLEFVSTAPGDNTAGIEISGATTAWFSHNRIQNIRFFGTTYCVRCTKTALIPSGYYHVLPFGQCLFSSLQTGPNDAGVYPEHGIYFDGSPGAHNIFFGNTLQCTLSGIKMGDGGAQTGVGDQQIIANSFNFCEDGVMLNGPINLNEYRDHIIIVGNQFDGGIVRPINAKRMGHLITTPNLYAFGVKNPPFSSQNAGKIGFDGFESEYGISKNQIPSGASVPLFDLFQTDISGYASAWVELSAGGTLAGTGQAQSTASISIIWNAGVPTIETKRVDHTGSGGAVITVTAVNNGGPVRFVSAINSISPGSSIDVNVKISSAKHAINLL